MLDDYLAAEPLLIQHAKANMTTTKHVLAAPDLQRIESGTLPTPSLVIMYMGDRIGQGAGHGLGVEVFQRWGFLVCVRNVQGQKTGDGSRREAGPIISEAIKTFQGWTPSADFRALVRRPANGAPGYIKGYAYFPLLYELQIMTVGNG